MSLTVLGLGTATPEQSIDQADAAAVAKTFIYGNGRQTQALPALFRRTRVRRRGSVLLIPGSGPEPRQTFYPRATTAEERGPTTEERMDRFARAAPPLALAAARRALQTSAVPAREITHLITVSCTGFTAPGVEFHLIEQLDLPATVGRVNVGFMGCHGALNGLRVAMAFGKVDPAARILMCAVELCSLHYQYGWNPQQLVANALFADGSAALVAAPGGGDADAGWSLAAVGSYLIPDASKEMTWRIGDHGFEMTLSPRLPHLLAEHLRPWLAGWLQSHGLTVEQVGSWAVHPGGPRILASVASALGLPPGATDVSTEVLQEHGNMSSATILFVLDRLRRRSAPVPWVALGFGPGLVVEAALFV